MTARTGAAWDAGLTPQQISLFDSYCRLLLEHRRRSGLTSLTERTQIERRHFGESLALGRALEAAGVLASPAIDIGTGAGFPGVPIKIMRPDLQLTLLEATGKKAAFLQLLVETLGLADVAVVQGRAEEMAHDPAHRERYRLALARAVAPLPVLVELALPFLQLGGVLAAPKGSGALREAGEATAALEACGGRVELVRALDVPWPGVAPTLVLVRKVAPTPASLPRRPGVPGKRPLGGRKGGSARQ